MIDSGGPSEPLLEAAERHGLDVELLLLTHHHGDHVAENHVWKERHGVEILAHPLEAAAADRRGPDDRAGRDARGRRPDDRVRSTRRVTRTGMLNFIVNGDGGVHRRHALQGLGRRRARARLDELRGPEALDHGRADGAPARDASCIRATPTRRRSATSGSTNAFVRVWRGLDAECTERCTRGRTRTRRSCSGRPDYDGGHKAWVRWDDGSDDIVPGSRVKRG